MDTDKQEKGNISLLKCYRIGTKGENINRYRPISTTDVQQTSLLALLSRDRQIRFIATAGHKYG